MTSVHDRTETILKSPENNIALPTTTPEDVEESIRLIDDLSCFLVTAPANWQENQIIRRYYLNSEQGFVSCVFWNNVYYITGTDIVKCCLYRMQKFGRTIVQRKKFEEGIFSDLRSLKCGIDATLEQPKSEFLAFLYRNSCLKTQKKQKVFFWFSVAHDKLFADALERDLKKETSQQQSTTKPLSEPALSFTYDANCGKKLYDQVKAHIDSKRLYPSSGDDFISNLIADDKEENRKVVPKIKLEESKNGSNDSLDFPDTERTEQTTIAPQSVSFDFPFDSNESTQKVDIPSILKNREETPLIEGENTYSEKQELEALPLEYFPIDIEYPDEINSYPISTATSVTQLANPNLEINESLKSGIAKVKKRSVVYSEIEQPSFFEQDEFFNNEKPDPRSAYYNTQPNYNQYFGMPQPNMVNVPYQGDIIAQSIEQPLLGFENIYTPQNVYNDFFKQQTAQQQVDLPDWNMLFQPALTGIPAPVSAHSINAYTPSYRTTNPNLWIKSPYANKTPVIYTQNKTPQVARRRQIHNLTPGTSKPQYIRMGKIGKPTIPSKNSSQTRLNLQKRMRESRKPISMPNISNSAGLSNVNYSISNVIANDNVSENSKPGENNSVSTDYIVDAAD